MNCKKIATLILFVIVILGYSRNSVSVAASEGAGTAATGGAVTSQDSVKKQNTSLKKDKKKKKNSKSYTKSELRLMSAIINAEAGGESFQGKLAVGIVVMNRIESKAFPNTLKGVIYQRGQFSPVRNGALKRKLNEYNKGKTGSKQWKDCIRAAQKVLEGQNYVTVQGNKKSLKGYHFFSVYLAHARFRLGGHRFK